jgi:hypothetical protein
MLDRNSRSCQPLAGLAVVLAATLQLSAGAQALPRHGRGAPLRVDVVSIGRARIVAEDLMAAGRSDAVPTSVGPNERVALAVTGPFPTQGRLYPLVRREGEEIWTVQPEAVGPGGRRTAGEWTAEVRFGGPHEVGKSFELKAMVAAEPLPRGPLPERMRVASLRAESAILRVERRRGRPEVTVTAVAGNGVYGAAELPVHEEDPIGVGARDLPDDGAVGVAVHPLGTGLVWVMPGTAGESGSIQAYFGAGDGSELSFHYTVSSFVALPGRWPPVDRGLPPLEWQELQAGFLAMSRPVPVARWQHELKIEQIGRLAVRPGLSILADRQVDVRGAAPRPLAAGERIWLVCIPPQSAPWIAGWTPRLSASGHWGIPAVRLQPDGRPDVFDLLAVVSADDARRVPPKALRAWLHDVEGEDVSTRVQVVAAEPRPAAPPAPPGRPR